MSKLKIFTFPDLVLAQKAKPIPRVERAYHKLADDMLETMYDAPGVGLAANQVGVLERIIVVDVDYEMVEPKEGEVAPEGGEVVSGGIITHRKPIILINPEIILREGKTEFKEACLSVPDFSSEVQRAEKVRVQYQDVDGLTKTLDADGLLAVCLQHELDHLDGKLFIDRLSTVKRDLAKKKLIRARREREDDDA